MAQKKPSIETLMSWASAGKWGFVDFGISRLNRDPAYFSRAEDLLHSRESYLRNLGASILQRISIPDDVHTRRIVGRSLGGVMSNYGGTYDGFRAACAVVVHNLTPHIHYAEWLLRGWAANSEVGLVARGYLGTIAQRKTKRAA